METQIQVRAGERPAAPARSIDNDLDNYLNALAAANATFRGAVDAYVEAEPDGLCWQHAKRIGDQIRTLDELQQRLETGVRAQPVPGACFCAPADPLTTVSRLVKEMKRQVTGFAIESGFSVPGRRVPAHLVADFQELADDVCGAVETLVESHRPGILWGEQPFPQSDERGVSWYESEADRLSTKLIKSIFDDDTLDIKARLSLAQLVEEIDRLADHAEAIDRELQVSVLGGLTSFAVRDSH